MTPTVEQADIHRISVRISDGATRRSFDEQSFEIYANHLPTIVSIPRTWAWLVNFLNIKLG